MKTALRILIVLSFIAIGCLAPGAAQAGPKPCYWGWWPKHWENLDFEPYLEDAKRPHNSQWNDSGWKPGHWVAQRGNDGMNLIRGFYAAGILSDQYEDDGVPVLEVGPSFYSLGGQDKRRVVETVDHVYQVTAMRTDGAYLLYDWRSKEPVGTYTRYGLQLQ